MREVREVERVSDDEFHQERRRVIGGSDSPVILGVSSYGKTKTQLALEKLGRAGPPPPPTAPMLRGTYLEPIIAKLFEEETTLRTLEHKDLIVHPKHPEIGGHIDRWVEGLDGVDRAVLEIKCPGLAVFSHVKWDGLLPDWIIQLQHYLAATGAPVGIFAVFNAELWQLMHFQVEADKELQSMIIEKDLEFWAAIQAGQTDFEEPAKAPVVDIPEARPGEILHMDTQQWAEAVNDLREAQEILAEAEELEKGARATLQMFMGRHQVAESPGFRAYWRWQQGKKSVDLKALKRDYPDIPWPKYEKTGKPFRTFKTYNLKEGRNSYE